MKRTIRIVVGTLAGAFATALSAAVTYTYSGSGSAGNWTDPHNWTASDGTSTGYPGTAETDVAVFAKDAGAVVFDFGGQAMALGELTVNGGSSDVTADITLKNVTMTVASKVFFDVGTSVRLSDGTTLAAGSSTVTDPDFRGSFVIDSGCAYVTAPKRYTKFGAKSVTRIGGTLSIDTYPVTIAAGAQIILEGGEYLENARLEAMVSQARDWSAFTGTGVINKSNNQWTLRKNATSQPALSPGLTYIWGKISGDADVIMDLACGTIEVAGQTTADALFYANATAGAKRSGFNFPRGSTAKVVFPNYTPASADEMFETVLFSPGKDSIGPHIYVGGLSIASAEQLQDLFDIELPYADGKGVSLALKNTTPSGASRLAVPNVPSVAGNQITFSGALSSLGSGTTTVSLEWWLGASAEVTNAVDVASFDPGASDLTFDKLVTFSDWPESVCWRFVSVNGSPEESFRDASDPATVAIQDAVTYAWKGDVTSGKWNDTENWTPSATPCRGYPNAAEATAAFTGPGDVTVDCSGMTVSLAALSIADGRGTVRLSGGAMSVAKVAIGTSAAATCALGLEEGASLDFLGGGNCTVWGQLIVGENSAYRQRTWTLVLKGAGEKVIVRSGAELNLDALGILSFASTDAKIRLQGGTMRTNKKVGYNSIELRNVIGAGLVEWNQFQFDGSGNVTSDLTIPEGMTFSFTHEEAGSGSVVNLFGDGTIRFRHGESDPVGGAFWNLNRFNISSASKIRVELPNYAAMTRSEAYSLLFNPDAADGKFYFLLDGRPIPSEPDFRRALSFVSPMENSERGVCFGCRKPVGFCILVK